MYILVMYFDTRMYEWHAGWLSLIQLIVRRVGISRRSLEVYLENVDAVLYKYEPLSTLNPLNER